MKVKTKTSLDDRPYKAISGWSVAFVILIAIVIICRILWDSIINIINIQL